MAACNIVVIATDAQFEATRRNQLEDAVIDLKPLGAALAIGLGALGPGLADLFYRRRHVLWPGPAGSSGARLRPGFSRSPVRRRAQDLADIGSATIPLSPRPDGLIEPARDPFVANIRSARCPG